MKKLNIAIVGYSRSGCDIHGAFLLANDIGIGFASVIWGGINDSFGFQTSIVCVIVCLVASYASAWIVYPARDKLWRH